jgi:hypothetical protein
MEQAETGDVFDSRVARWRNDPYIAEMLEIIQKLSRYDEEGKGWALIRMRICLGAIEKELAKGPR